MKSYTLRANTLTLNFNFTLSGTAPPYVRLLFPQGMFPNIKYFSQYSVYFQSTFSVNFSLN